MNEKKVILIHPPSHMIDPEPPLGLLFLSTVLEKAGCQTEIIDMEPHKVSVNDIKVLIESTGPLFVAISFMTAQYTHMKRIVEAIKSQNHHVPVIVGGIHASALPEDILKETPQIDYLAAGEGEKTIVDFFHFLCGKMQINEVRGLYYRRSDTIVKNSDRELMTEEELNSLPPLRWDKLFDKGLYYRLPIYGTERTPYYSIITARGCPYNCMFCDEITIWKRKLRETSIDKVVSEIEYLYNNYGARDIQILDDTFTLKAERVYQFCDEIIEKGIKINFKVTARADRVTLNMLKRMKEAGVVQVGYGVESGDQSVLNLINKKLKKEDMIKAIEMTREAGLISFALLMVGNPGEGFNSVKMTAKFIKELNADFYSCAIMTPYPGSQVFELYQKNGWILDTNWDNYITSPHRVKNYTPVACSDKMSSDELMRAYYFINRTIYFKKIEKIYGNLFFLNKLFYYQEVFKRIKASGMKRFFSNFFNLMKNRSP